MKKLLIALVFAFVGMVAYGQQLDTIKTVGSGIHSMGGDSKKIAYEKLNDAILVIDTLAYGLVTDTVTAGTPTEAEITAALGFGPTEVVAGMKYYILDATSTNLIYIIISDGTNWQWSVMTIAS